MPASDQGKAPAYKVKRAELVIRGSDVQARLFTLAPGERFLGIITGKAPTITSCLAYPAAYPCAQCACSINGGVTAVRSAFVDQGGAAVDQGRAAQNTE